MANENIGFSDESSVISSFRKFIDSLDDGHQEHRLPQRAYQIIRLGIRDLILPPGSMILEREVGEALQMSRTPVREALVRLETEGLLRLVPRKGFVVEPIEKEDLREIYEVAENLEGLAVELATEIMTEEEIGCLEDINVQLEKALQNNQLNLWAHLDHEFHSSVIQFSKNKRLETLIDVYSDQLYRARLYTIHNRPILIKSIDEHKAMIACMKAKEGLAGRTIMQSHRKRAKKEIIRALDNIKEDKGS